MEAVITKKCGFKSDREKCAEYYAVYGRIVKKRMKNCRT